MNIMWTKASFVAALVAALPVCGTVAVAQSLGAVAKQEEARRKSVKTPGKVYTNDSLKTEGSSSPEPPNPSAADTTQPAPAAPAVTQPKDGEKPATDDPKKDE